MYIGERIRLLRVLNGLTQKQLGEKIGCPRNTLSRWEDDPSARVPIEVVTRIARSLDTTPSYLSFGAPRITRGNWLFSEVQRLPKGFHGYFDRFLVENGIDEAITVYGLAGGGSVWFFGSVSNGMLHSAFSITCCGWIVDFMEKAIRRIPFKKMGIDWGSYTPEAVHKAINRKNSILKRTLLAHGITLMSAEDRQGNDLAATSTREKDLERVLRKLVRECSDRSGAILRPSLTTVIEAKTVLGVKK